MNITITADMGVCKGIAMAKAPFLTGNVRFNAIKDIRTNRGFRIKYSLSDAFYIYFLEEGTRKSMTHQGFIGNNTVPTIASYLYAKYASQDKKVVNRFKYVSKNSKIDFGVTEQRIQVNQNSLNLDVQRIANENKWKHELGIEVFDPKFMERTI